MAGIQLSPSEGRGGIRLEFFRTDPGGGIPLEKVHPLGPDPRDKTIRDVYFHHLDGPVTRVRIVHALQYSLQGMAKLH